MKMKNNIVNIARLIVAALWLKDDEMYTVYYKNLTIRINLALMNCFQVTLSQLSPQYTISFVILPDEMEYFSKILDGKLSELWEN